MSDKTVDHTSEFRPFASILLLTARRYRSVILETSPMQRQLQNLWPRSTQQSASARDRSRQCCWENYSEDSLGF